MKSFVAVVIPAYSNPSLPVPGSTGVTDIVDVVKV